MQTLHLKDVVIQAEAYLLGKFKNYCRDMYLDDDGRRCLIARCLSSKSLQHIKANGWNTSPVENIDNRAFVCVNADRRAAINEVQFHFDGSNDPGLRRLLDDLYLKNPRLLKRDEIQRQAIALPDDPTGPSDSGDAA